MSNCFDRLASITLTLNGHSHNSRVVGIVSECPANGHMGLIHGHMVFGHTWVSWKRRSGSGPGLKLNQSLLYKAGHIAPESRGAAADISIYGIEFPYGMVSKYGKYGMVASRRGFEQQK